MNILMIGPPGSGKGTQGIKLAEHLGLNHIAAGDLLRAEVKGQTPIGVRMQDIMQRGELVPDLIIVALLIPEMIRAIDAGGYVLDGYPRSVPQAELTREVVDQMGLGADLVLYLDVPHDVLVERILERAKVEGRSDDTAEIVTNRLRVFEEATRPLLHYYQARDLVKVIDSNRPIDEVTADVFRAAESVKKNL